jgi:taurine dioxygenase
MLQDVKGAYRTIKVEPRAQGFGADVTGLDLREALADEVLAEVKAAWAAHAVLRFPDQPLSLDELEAFTLQMGPFGVDPYVAPMEGHPNVLEVRREPDEKLSVFGGGWHSDWSFQQAPPSATLLRSQIIPPIGGDTLFCDGCCAYEALDEARKAELAPLRAVHSASFAYGPNGIYAREKDVHAAKTRAMSIIVSDTAEATCAHPLVRTHPVTGRKSLFVSPVYTHAVEGMSLEEGQALLAGLFKHMHQDEFIYRLRWRRDMLVMWDNRCTTHYALGGYDGHRRLMHRTTVAGEVPI